MSNKKSHAIWHGIFFGDILFFAVVFFLTVLAAVYLTLLVCQDKDLVKLLLHRGNAAGVLAGDYISYLLWQNQLVLFYYGIVLDDVAGNVVIYKA